MSDSREATPDERAGMAWWNGLMEFERNMWARRAGTGVVADAWRLYKEEVASAEPVRVYGGLRFDGVGISLMLVPGVDGWLGMTVDAHPSVTGYDGGVRLTSDDAGSVRYGLGSFKIGETLLEAFGSRGPDNSRVPSALYSVGCRVLLEPHMPRQLRTWLEPLCQAAALARALASAVERALPDGHPVAHMHSFTVEVASAVVLDGRTPDDALAYANTVLDWVQGSDPRFVDAFRCGEPMAQLETAAFQRGGDYRRGAGAGAIGGA